MAKVKNLLCFDAFGYTIYQNYMGEDVSDKFDTFEKKAEQLVEDTEKAAIEKISEAKTEMDGALGALRRFFKMESAGGIMLMMGMVVAMIFANTPLKEYYHQFLDMKVTVLIGGFGVDKDLLHWINDGLMAIFFLLVGLEIKREVLEGELSSRQQAMLPAIAAAGGIAVPALIYTFFNNADPIKAHGWAIPAATDIAFALGILALFGKRVPIALKIFLTAVAVMDDLAAIVIIAIFYTENLSLTGLGVGLFCLTILFFMNQRGVNKTSLFVFIGFIMWLAVLKSGVHATLAGVALGFMIPHRSSENTSYSMLKHFEHGLHGWVAFLVLPVFAFANAGIDFSQLTMDYVTASVPMGIALGLFVGKQIGIFSISWLAIKLGFGKLPDEVNWKQFYGVSLLCGIGFTMSLFIGGLAFNVDALTQAETNSLELQTRLGVLMGSGVSAILGSLMLYLSLPTVEERLKFKEQSGQKS